MDEQQREFRVGMMVIIAAATAAFLVLRFGEIGADWKSGRRISILLPSATGIYTESTVRLRGIQIGQVEQIDLMPGGNGVTVTARINNGISFPSGSRARLVRSLLGDGVIEILPAQSGPEIRTGDRIVGSVAEDPTAVVARLETQVAGTLESFRRTGEQWEQLAGNLNRMLVTTGPDGTSTLDQTAAALHQFTQTMRTAETTLEAAGGLLNDPQYQQHLRATLSALPEMLNETRQTLSAVNGVIHRVDSLVGNLDRASQPLAARSGELVGRLNSTLANVDAVSRRTAALAEAMQSEDGTVQRLISDPSLYRNLNATSESLAVMLQNLGPVLADLRVFSDKIARHPELLGVRGVVRGSDGSKGSRVRQAEFSRE